MFVLLSRRAVDSVLFFVNVRHVIDLVGWLSVNLLFIQRVYFFIFINKQQPFE